MLYFKCLNCDKITPVADENARNAPTCKECGHALVLLKPTPKAPDAEKESPRPSPAFDYDDEDDIKPYEVLRRQPRTVFLGTSRIHEAFNPAVLDGTPYAPAYNAAVPGASIAENIAYGGGAVDAGAIERAARLACLHEEILAMPGGYRAAVAERGQNLSGGQKQRIALARVFLKNPPILILDEGTSALDTVSERRVRQAIEAARQDRTVILVAHRLSTLRHAHRVVVFEEGRIVEVGAYEELVRRGGALSALVRCAGDSQEAAGPAEGGTAAVRRAA